MLTKYRHHIARGSPAVNPFGEEVRISQSAERQPIYVVVVCVAGRIKVERVLAHLKVAAVRVFFEVRVSRSGAAQPEARCGFTAVFFSIDEVGACVRRLGAAEGAQYKLAC